MLIEKINSSELCIFTGAAEYYIFFSHSMRIFQFNNPAITLDLYRLYLSYYTLGHNTVLFPLSAEANFYSNQQYKPENSFQISDWKKIICSNY